MFGRKKSQKADPIGLSSVHVKETKHGSNNGASSEFRSYADALKDFLRSLTQCFEEEGWGDLVVTPLGRLVVSIQFSSEEEASSFVENNRSVWSCWLNKLHVWDSTAMVDSRFAVVQICGLPFPDL
ncbi:hypothetical protein OSB04_023706 [Centaurea solstitialis]|uniref:Uncharacterized protein n=1 Tax=Centaurea solstitialis TaxID=347529 RepID=A0AA38SLF3_9ASTR|nr:hypothetical protein OSB04_023706 [Centaurea solstitialis]